MGILSVRRWGLGELVFIAGIALWIINVLGRGGRLGLPITGLDVMVLGIGLMLLRR